MAAAIETIVVEGLVLDDHPTGVFEQVFSIARTKVHPPMFAEDRQQTINGRWK
jgi:hypothetical protein